METDYQGFLVKKNNKIKVNHKITNSILINNLHVDLLLQYKHLFRGKLLDAGCGEKPYSLIYRDGIEEGIGCDVKTCVHNQKNVDIFASLDDLPFQDEEFDTIICTDVLEYVANSNTAYTELARVLKRGGHLIITVPFLYPVHEAPHDYYRYTKYGLEFQLNENGLEIEKFLSCGGIGLLLAVYANFFFCKFLKIKILQKFCSYLQELYYWVYKKIFFTRIINAKSKLSNIVSVGYFVIAKK